MADDTERLAGIEKRADGATEGPWHVAGNGGSYPTDMGTEYWSETFVEAEAEQIPDGPNFVVCQLGEGEESVADATFIAAARADVPWLLDRCRRLEAERDKARAATIVEAVRAIESHAETWAPADGNAAQRRNRRHLLIAARVVGNLDPPTHAEIVEALSNLGTSGGVAHLPDE